MQLFKLQFLLTPSMVFYGQCPFYGLSGKALPQKLFQLDWGLIQRIYKPVWLKYLRSSSLSNQKFFFRFFEVNSHEYIGLIRESTNRFLTRFGKTSRLSPRITDLNRYMISVVKIQCSIYNIHVSGRLFKFCYIVTAKGLLVHIFLLLQ